MAIVPRICLECKTEFQADEREIRRGNAKFCSLKCSGKHRSKTISVKEPNVICSYCSIPIYKPQARIKNSKTGVFFCCREHKDLAQRLGGVAAIQPAHYGTAKVPEYRKKAFAAYPHKCSECGWDTYSDVLQVHHMDKDRTNNSVNNLVILCPNHHAIWHYLDRSGIFWNNNYSA